MRILKRVKWQCNSCVIIIFITHKDRQPRIFLRTRTTIGSQVLSNDIHINSIKAIGRQGALI